MPSSRNSPQTHTDAYYRALMEHSYDLVAVLNGDGEIELASPSAERMLGLEPSRLRGERLLDRVHPADRSVVEQAMHPSRSTPGEPRTLTFRLRTESEQWLVMEAVVTRVADAQVDGTILNARDVTARVTAEREERMGRERIGRFQRLIAGLAANPIVDMGDLADAAKEICRVAAKGLDVERASVWLLGEGNLELEGIALYELTEARYSVPPSLRAPDYPSYFKALESGRAIDANDARSDPRTSEFREGYLEPLGIVSMLDAAARLSGRVVGVVCCEHVGEPRIWTPEEVTFAGELADQVVRALVGVSHKEAVEARSEVQNQLLHAQKLSTIGTLTSGIAHDFNNILAPILGYSEMARDELDEGTRAREYLEEVIEAAGRAQDLIVRILRFSRKVELRPEPTDARQVVTEAVKLVRATLPENIGIATDMVAEPVPVHADSTQLHQVLMNLCTNASQAFDGSAGLLSISVGIEPGPAGDVASIVVADDGCGMEANVAERVFEPFFSTKAIGEGTGLGLSVVKSIVEDHGGTVAVESQPGEGTTFSVRLPLATPDPSSGHS